MSQSPTVIFNAAATINASVTVGVEQVDLLSVIGRLDDPGLELLQSRLDELLAGGTKVDGGGPVRGGRLRRTVV